MVKFVGYVQYAPNHYQPEFIVTGSLKVPDGSQLSADTIMRLGIKREPFSIPSYWSWTRERFLQLLKNREMLRRFENGNGR